MNHVHIVEQDNHTFKIKTEHKELPIEVCENIVNEVVVNIIGRKVNNTKFYIIIGALVALCIYLVFKVL